MSRYPLSKLVIEDFQSIRHIELEFASDGLYWIRGKNNVGKSAIIKALSALFTNVSNNKYKEMIRDGSTTFNVKAWFGPDYVELSRGGSDYYEWSFSNGESGRVDKTAGKVPPELEAYFNLYYEPEKTNRYLNLTGASDSLLFTESTGGDNYRLLQKALGTELLTKATKESDKIKRATLSENKTLLKLKEEKEDELPKYEAVHQVLEDRQAQLSRLKGVLDGEMEIYRSLNNQYDTVDTLMQFAEVVIGINSDLELYNQSNIESELTDIDVIKGVKQLHDELNVLDTSLSDLHLPDDRLLGEASTLINELGAIQSQVSQLVTYNVLEGQQQELGVVSDDELGAIQGDINSIAIIKDLLGNYNTYIDLAGRSDQIDDELSQLDIDYEASRKELGICPYCNSVLDSNHSHKGVS